MSWKTFLGAATLAMAAAAPVVAKTVEAIEMLECGRRIPVDATGGDGMPAPPILWFGAGFGVADPVLRAQLGLAADEGLPVIALRDDADSLAKRAGFELHDVILSVNGAKIGNAAAFVKVYGETASGQALRIIALRAGRAVILGVDRP